MYPVCMELFVQVLSRNEWLLLYLTNHIFLHHFNVVHTNCLCKQVMWDDIIGEPEGIKSTQCAWNCSYKCFRGTNRCCYILLTTLFGPCLAFCSAINFACLAFQVSNANNNEAVFFKLAGRRDVGNNDIAIGLSKLELKTLFCRAI